MSVPHDNHEPTSVEELHDRLMDRGLAEVVGGETPPDLSDFILAGKRPSELAAAPAATDGPRSRRALWIGLAIAATLLIAAVPVLWSAVNNSSGSRNLSRVVPIADPRATFAEAKETPPPSNDSPPQSETPTSLAQLAESSQLGPVDVTFTEGANTVIIRGRQEDVDRVKDLVDQVEKLKIETWNEGQQTALVGRVPPTGTREITSSQDGFGVQMGLQGSVSSDGGGEGEIQDFSSGNMSLVLPQTKSTTDFPRFTSDIEVSNRPNSFQSADQLPTTTIPSDTEGDGILDGDGIASGEFLLAGGGDSKVLNRGWKYGFSGRRADWDFDSRHDEMAPMRPDKVTPDGTGPGLSGDQYVRIYENPFVQAVGPAAVSTFSIDVDTASYTNVRRFLLTERTLPPADAVRIEELVNYFKYDYAAPVKGEAKTPADGDNGISIEESEDSAEAATQAAPFAAHLEVAGCPWKPEHRLVRIGIKGYEMDRQERPKSNLVFLVDVSGSMNEPSKLPLVIDGLRELTGELGENDRVAIVVYASREGLVLPSTPGSEQAGIMAALGQLRAGGSTAGGAGIQLAYQIAEDHFIEGGTNRVILCTDGDFNVGTTSTAELERLVEEKAKNTSVFLSVLGFGRGNLNDQMMEAISGRGNGNYHYVDNLREARRVFVQEMTGTLVTIAKDVKIQVELNPRQVAAYRLLGYENRMLRTEDFNDDTKDAGEIGAGHTVTALYELVPAGTPVDLPPVDELKYQKTVGRTNLSVDDEANARATDTIVRPTEFPDVSRELLTLKMKYKRPDADTSEDALEWAITDEGKAFSGASSDFQFAAAVAGFGMLLRDSQHKGNLTYAAVLELAQGGLGQDEDGYRGELLEMVRRAKQLRGE